jgi:hypothetical protein
LQKFKRKVKHRKLTRILATIISLKIQTREEEEEEGGATGEG